jgi:hypothetical protein
MSQGESKLSRSIIDAIRARGGFAFKVHGNALMMAGLPDVIGCYRGFMLALETKMPEGKGPEPIQRLRIKQIRGAGGVSYVVRSVRDARRVMDAIDRKIDLGPSEAVD